jgi:hypothetical protein
MGEITDRQLDELIEKNYEKARKHAHKLDSTGYKTTWKQSTSVTKTAFKLFTKSILKDILDSKRD